ncbi:MAG: hypothetical protein CL930_06300 [Deltaproteobacteria bacterium]|nr:hypothetical protein [Deltaproteobacteria bacterium]
MLEDLFDTYGVLLAFVALITTPIGNPVPEEVSLLGAGYVAGTGQNSFFTSLFVGYMGVVIGDCISWAMGRRVGLERNGFLAKIVGMKQVARIQRFYARFGDRTILICRQLPGFRLPCFFIAGASGMPFRRFILIDGSAALVTATIFVWLGYANHDEFQQYQYLVERFSSVFQYVFALVLCMVAYRIIDYQLVRRRMEAAKRIEE